MQNDSSEAAVAADQQASAQVFRACAILQYKARTPDELSFEEDDIITIVAEKGDGYFIGYKADGSSGAFPLKYVELEPWPESGSKQRLMAQMKLLKDELEEAQKRRTEVQAEVTQLREEKKLLQEEADPIRFAIRTDQDLVHAVLQLELKSALMWDSMLAFQSSMRQTTTDVTTMRNSVDDPELDPLRVDIVERVENLRLKLGIFEQPVADAVASAQALQREAPEFVAHFRAFAPPPVVATTAATTNPRQKRGRMRAEGFSVAASMPPMPDEDYGSVPAPTPVATSSGSGSGSGGASLPPLNPAAVYSTSPGSAPAPYLGTAIIPPGSSGSFALYDPTLGGGSG